MKDIFDHHKKLFQHDYVVALFVSIDATKVAPIVQENQRYRQISGGTTIDNFILLPDESDDIIADFIVK